MLTKLKRKFKKKKILFEIISRNLQLTDYHIFGIAWTEFVNIFNLKKTKLSFIFLYMSLLKLITINYN